MKLPTLIGHRGARGEAPENTLASFLHAYKEGIRDFELDIRISKDEELIVNHDVCVLRTTSNNGNIEDLTVAELMEMDARSTMTDWPEPARIPTLKQVLDACPEAKSWQFEVKTSSDDSLKKIAKKLNELIIERGLQKKAIVTSLNKKMLKHMRKVNPDIRRGFVCEKLSKKPIETALKYQCTHLCLYFKITSEALVHEAQTEGLHVSCWTVNNLNVADALLSWGVDSLIVDYPTAFRGYYKARRKRKIKAKS
ncbi:MAG: glycerophosphodiester phosphodiesterase [Pseudomonadota bacterium]|nr:glycerophosphodiester phosphodiesterase [Pseudomonadota bacterium]